jgi:hypothetical protein
MPLQPRSRLASTHALFCFILCQALSNGTMDQAEAVAKVKEWRPLAVDEQNKKLTTGVY